MTQAHIGFVEMSSTGAGQCALRYAARQGYRVTVFSRAPESLGSCEGDVTVIPCETNDPAQIIAACTKARITLTGVTTTHDFYVPQAAAVARVLSLPGLDPEAALDARNKIRMRRRLAKAAPQLNPLWTVLPTTGDASTVVEQIGLPVVGKPANVNDSWGVELLNGLGDVEQYMRAAKEWRTNDAGQDIDDLLLFEQYVDGAEYSVETAQPFHGPRTCMGITGKPAQRSQGHFAEAELIFPVTTSGADKAQEAAFLALDALHLTGGTLHTEVRVTDGGAKVLEVNPRLAGDMTGSHMIELAVGASAIEQMVEIALGNRPPWQPTRQRGVGKVGVTLPRSGRFRSLDNRDEILALPGVREVRVMVTPGTISHVPPRTNGDYVLRVIAESDTPEQALSLAKLASSAARFTSDDLS